MKIAFTGPECSGKSTTSKALAQQFHLPWVREYAREHLEQLGREYAPDDIITIAQKQFALWKENAFVADTEMLVCSIWYEEKTGKRSDEIESLLRAQKFDLYFLCQPDIPWEFDELRENPDDRERLFEIYKSRLEEHSLPYILIKGDMKERFTIATETVQDLVKNNH
jgi:nicotinamide riboside kinase